jgi:hypothetical protein
VEDAELVHFTVEQKVYGIMSACYIFEAPFSESVI